jgi:hypothetical protein
VRGEKQGERQVENSERMPEYRDASLILVLTRQEEG